MAKCVWGMTVALFGLMAMPSLAQADEIRLGVMAHDVDVFTGHSYIKENSAAVSAEYIFDTPKWLDWAWKARPYIYGTANLGGHTHHGGAGLNWQVGFLGKFYGEFETGLSVHSGTNSISFPVLSGVTDAQRLANIHDYFYQTRTEIEFGSTVLFRNQLAIGYRFNDIWSADVSYEHLSHGGLFNATNNDGVDSVGLRVSRKF